MSSNSSPLLLTRLVAQQFTKAVVALDGHVDEQNGGASRHRRRAFRRIAK